jgi:hypothetical protein
LKIGNKKKNKRKNIVKEKKYRKKCYKRKKIMNIITLKMKAYIVVTEHYYGNSKYIRLFSSSENALSYKNDLENRLNVDVLIIESEIDNVDYVNNCI